MFYYQLAHIAFLIKKFRWNYWGSCSFSCVLATTFNDREEHF